jgi:hypothetical protein
MKPAPPVTSTRFAIAANTSYPPLAGRVGTESLR